MKNLLILISLIVGAVFFLQALWFMLDHGVKLEVIGAVFVVYSVFEMWLHGKGKH